MSGSRILAGLCAFAIALCAGIAVAEEMRLSSVQGQVEVGVGEPPAWRMAEEGEVLSPGARVRTGADGRAEARLGASRLRVYENSLLRIPGGRRVDVERGASLFEILLEKVEDSFEVHTPEVATFVKGTRFAVQAERGISAVRVFEGVVSVRELGPGARTLASVGPGFAAASGPARPLSLFAIDGRDPWSGWAEGGAAPPAPRALVGPSPDEIAREKARRVLRDVIVPAAPDVRDDDPARKRAPRWSAKPRQGAPASREMQPRMKGGPADASMSPTSGTSHGSSGPPGDLEDEGDDVDETGGDAS